jgi:DNA-binding PadR family transcriptional regulator
MALADQLKKGTTMLAVLHALERGPVYAYGLRRETFEKTRGIFGFNESALYPLLHSLERQGLVAASTQRVRGRHRRYYRLTSKGRQTLIACRHEWKSLLKSLEAILN